jgi:hypothetical protein
MKQSKTLTVHDFGTAETNRVSGNWDSRGSTSNINPVRTKTMYLVFRSYTAKKKTACIGYNDQSATVVSLNGWLLCDTYKIH